MLLPLCIPHAPLPVADHPQDFDDVNFWQFPAITEKLAWMAHAVLRAPTWNSDSKSSLDSYLGLPWATYIDKQLLRRAESGPSSTQFSMISSVFVTRMRGYRQLADRWQLEWGADVRVHSVCQHIYWDTLLPLWVAVGLTDVHLSHCESDAVRKGAEWGIRVHSWPLVAANQVNPDRQMGLKRTAPICTRTYLASFVGSHMGHYRSDVRLRLKEEVEQSGRKDVIFKLGDEWHYNSIVYEEQVRGTTLDETSKRKEAEATRLYNEVMSNSVFALCPEGAGPNTIRLWEALAAGAIPVIIVEDWIWPEIRGLQLSWDDVAIRCRRDDVTGLIDQLHFLRENCSAKLERMQRDGRKVYDHFSTLTCFPAP